MRTGIFTSFQTSKYLNLLYKCKNNIWYVKTAIVDFLTLILSYRLFFGKTKFFSAWVVGRCVHRRASRALLINSGDRLYMTVHSSNPKGSIHGTVDEENPQSQYDWDLVWLIYIPRRQTMAWEICFFSSSAGPVDFGCLRTCQSVW